MAEGKSKKGVVAVALLAFIGALGYLAYSLVPKKDEEEEEDGDVDGGDVDGDDSSSGGGGGGGSYVAPTEDPMRAIAAEYRLWANSTDALSKKYGKESSYNLDAEISGNPNNSWFRKSYAAGKAEFEAWKKKQSVNAVIKPIYDIVSKGSGKTTYLSKDNSRNSAKIDMVEYKSDKKPLIYYWKADGTMSVWNRDKKQTVTRGNWSKSGKSIAVTFGSNKGKTFTNNSPVVNAYLASYNPMENQTYSEMSTYKLIADNLYDAMKGGGTVDRTFWRNMKKIKTTKDYDLVKSKYGKKGGYNLVEWIKGDIVAEDESKHFNYWAKKYGWRLKLKNSDGTEWEAKNIPSVED